MDADDRNDFDARWQSIHQWLETLSPPSQNATHPAPGGWTLSRLADHECSLEVLVLLENLRRHYEAAEPGQGVGSWLDPAGFTQTTIAATAPPPTTVAEARTGFQRTLEAEYAALTDTYEQRLRTWGFGDPLVAPIPADLQHRLTVLVQVAELLGLKSCRVANYQAALAQLRHKHRDVRLELAEMDHVRQRQRQSTKSARRLLQRIRGMLAEAEPVKPAEEQKIREWTHNTQLLARKATEYQARLDDLANEYAERRIEARGLDYPTLQASDTRIRELSDRLREGMRRLESYQALPPDITLATIKLDEANSALATLEKQREELLCQLAEQLG